MTSERWNILSSPLATHIGYLGLKKHHVIYVVRHVTITHSVSEWKCGGWMSILRVLLPILFPPQIQHKTLQSSERNGIEHNEH